MGNVLKKSAQDEQVNANRQPAAEQSNVTDEQQEIQQEGTGSTSDTAAAKPEEQPPQQLIEFAEIRDDLKTGDLLILYRHNSETPNYGIIINNSANEQYFPLLLVKGVTKPMHKDSFRKKRYLTAITAVERIYYGDYERVAVCRIQGLPEELWAKQALDLVDTFETLHYTEDEIKMIEEAESPAIRSTTAAILNLSLFYHKLNVLDKHNTDIMSVLSNWHTTLPMSEPVFINVPPLKPGPMKKGEPPLYQKILRGLMPFSEETHQPYDSIKDSLNTGDIILFSTVGTSGFVIKLGSKSQFSHVGLVLRPKGATMLMVWESTSNSVGVVDLGSVTINGGTQIIPLKHKILNGYNDEVAIRRLVDVTDEQRALIQEKMMKLTKENEGKQYEKNVLKMVQADLDFGEEYLSFLKSDEEDVSTVFCSELIAYAYKEAGLIGDEIPSDEYTPDDFASKKDLQLKYGRLEPEIYIQLKYDD